MSIRVSPGQFTVPNPGGGDKPEDTQTPEEAPTPQIGTGGIVLIVIGALFILPKIFNGK